MAMTDPQQPNCSFLIPFGYGWLTATRELLVHILLNCERQYSAHEDCPFAIFFVVLTSPLQRPDFKNEGDFHPRIWYEFSVFIQ